MYAWNIDPPFLILSPLHTPAFPLTIHTASNNLSALLDPGHPCAAFLLSYTPTFALGNTNSTAAILSAFLHLVHRPAYLAYFLFLYLDRTLGRYVSVVLFSM